MMNITENARLNLDLPNQSLLSLLVVVKKQDYIELLIKRIAYFFCKVNIAITYITNV